MAKKITIYSTSSCGACKATKAHLDELGINYTDINIGEDADAMAKMMELNGGVMTVPTVDVDGEVIVGFDLEKLDSLVKK